MPHHLNVIPKKVTIESPHISKSTLATHESIEATIQSLIDVKDDPFAILNGEKEGYYMQTLLTPISFVVEYQEGSLDAHFESIRSDISAEEVIGVFCDYAAGNETWKARIEFKKMEEHRSFLYHIGYKLGKVLGNISAFIGIK